MTTERKKAMPPKLPLPIHPREHRKTVTTTLNKPLLEATSAEMEKRGLRLCDVLEWGMKRFLLEANPQAAKQLGIE